MTFTIKSCNKTLNDFGRLILEIQWFERMSHLQLKIMEESLQRVGHFQVALLWLPGSPNLTNNKPMAEQRLQRLEKRLLKDEDLFFKYRTTMQEYIAKGHAQKVSRKRTVFEKTTSLVPSTSSGDTPTETGKNSSSFRLCSEVL